MPYHITSYYQLTESQRQSFFVFLQDAGMETSQPAHENMWHDDWQNRSGTLLYLLEYTNRFSDNGEFTVVFDGNIVVGCSGVYSSSFCDKIAIAGTRTWINRDYRHRLISRDVLLPREKQWAIEHGFAAVAICFNDYNKNMIEIWRRTRLGENRPIRQSHHLFYNGVEEVEFPVMVQYTKQWLIYERLSSDFSFDWNTIKA